MHLSRVSLPPLIVILVIIGGCSPAAPPRENVTPTNTILPTESPSPVPTSLPATPVEPTATSLPTPVPPTSTPDVPFEEVNFTTEDGISIAATLFGNGQPAILLLHMGKGKATGNDQQDWHPFARTLAEQGFSALAVDFRGRGASGGEFVNDPVVLDARAALDFLHQRGYSDYICMGAGLGGTTCMVLALTDPPQGLVILSSSMSVGPANQVTEADLVKLKMPKLFLYGEKDAFGFPEAMQNIYRRAAEPKALLTCDSAAHGTTLLYGSCGQEIDQRILDFIQEFK
ncbi:MAG: alpha/beta hydrolase [Anaerolineales bacterium]|jgi:pimeloyl-ACP methyl ester carboxylesterase